MTHSSVQSDNFEGVMRTRTGSFWELYGNLTSSAYHGSGSLNGVLVGVTPAFFVPFYAKYPQSIAYTYTLQGGPSTATARITGENQFGDVVTELVNLVNGAGVTVQTIYCYRRVTAFAFTAIAAGGGGGAFQGGDTFGFGYSLVNPRLPMLAKLESPGTILNCKDMNEANESGQLPFRAVTRGALVIAAETTGLELYNILFTGTLTGGTAGPAVVKITLNPDDGGL